jgi:cephalosporin hydroxylase
MIIQEILFKVKPDVVIELGTNVVRRGGGGRSGGAQAAASG